MGKHFSLEYKEYVSKLVVEEGRKASDVAYELEISYKTICRWVKIYKDRLIANQSGVVSISPSELEKLKKQHEKEIQQLKEENEILKKAMHIFTKNPE
ncbi:transposase [Cytobacillus eiseniae]|uniref:Transposase n=1 Tax=Cytobacillus eiseniae TaxID=762947 RepID=A0ABS4RGJ2_9BACI|nr:transposase [Cytobacillus eiseniae]MBP2241485.1 transposase [Cytobacillus eiseniae]